MKKLIGYLSRRPKWQICMLCIFLVVFLGVIDYLTGDFSLTIFYLLPVCISTWLIGIWAGIAYCLFSGVAITVAHKIPPITVFDPAIMHIWNSAMEICFLIIMSYMIYLLKKELAIEQTLARTDHLTGALNRRSFLELAEYEIHQARRHQWPLTIAYIDLDNFKMVNDQQGHDAGDLLLRTVVRVLRVNSRNTDLAARIGGDEFCILLPDTNEKSARDVLRHLQNLLLMEMQTNRWPVTFSIGAVTYTIPPDSVDVILKAADARMYQVKQTGKNSMLHAAIDHAMDSPNGTDLQS